MINRRTFIRSGALFVPTIFGIAQQSALFRRRIPPVASTEYTAYATTFDGSDDWLERDADLTSCVDGKEGTVSFWIDFSGGDGVLQYVYYNASSRVSIQKRTTNTMRVQGANAAGTTILRIDQDSAKVAALTAATGWVHFMASWDLATATGYVYINNTECLLAATLLLTNDTLDYTRTDHGIMGEVGGGAKVNGCISELYFNQGESIDLSDSGNRALFYGGGTPPDLGSDGSGPTGTQPIIYLKNPYNSFTTNSGFGGNFVYKGTGALTDCTAP